MILVGSPTVGSPLSKPRASGDDPATVQWQHSRTS